MDFKSYLPQPDRVRIGRPFPYLGDLSGTSVNCLADKYPLKWEQVMYNLMSTHILANYVS
jgi:hypothetical protein